MLPVYSREFVGQSDARELAAAYEASADLPERFREALSNLFDTTPDRLDLGVEAGLSRAGDEATVDAVIDAVVRNPDRRIRFLEIAGGPTYVEPRFASDFGSPWVARRIAASLPVDAMAVDRLPSALLEPTDEWAGFACFLKTAQGDVLPFQYISHSTDESDVLTSVIGRPPLSTIHEERFMPINSSYLEELEYATRELGLKPKSPLAYFRKQHGEAAVAAGAFYIRPVVDAAMEQRFFNLAVRGGVNARDVSQLPGEIDVVSLRHTGTYFNLRDVEGMRSILGPDGRLLVSGDPPADMLRVAV